MSDLYFLAVSAKRTSEMPSSWNRIFVMISVGMVENKSFVVFLIFLFVSECGSSFLGLFIPWEDGSLVLVKEMFIILLPITQLLYGGKVWLDFTNPIQKCPGWSVLTQPVIMLLWIFFQIDLAVPLLSSAFCFINLVLSAFGATSDIFSPL